MNGLRFLEEKRYFIFMHLAMMAFVALVMFASPNGRYDAGDLIYTLTGCTGLAAIYLIGGYLRWRSRCRVLSERVKSSREDDWLLLPNPQTVEQQLYQEIIKKLQKRKEKEAEKYDKEQKDYQDFILSWIHEVRLPITACHMLIQNSAGKPVDELADKLEDEIRNIDHLVEQALYYSRIDSFSKDYLISEVPVHQAVRSSVKKYAKLFVAKRIRFTMPDEELWVHSDSKWLGYIIDQILSNALKYTDGLGAIECAFEENMEEKRLIIRDSGIGIHPEDIGRVFEKGFTGSTGRTERKSTGMGLYLANQMAIKLGHRLSVQSELGTYTQMTIHFPKTVQLFDIGENRAVDRSP
jgi:signal transduction histidine kinase